ncbi:hypothetical protein AC579_9708 [Pseudocercospora musae]|uniref:Uncharacterized protein n=1 Tax=Pseudocercospora musae TaxID=113226 RepID=A0A139I5Y8_9PEZI|nr:hypothetical protein AC579_9708 [Pseudocercospora musae]
MDTKSSAVSKEELTNSERIRLAAQEGLEIQNEELQVWRMPSACVSDECWTCQLQFPDCKHQKSNNAHYKYAKSVSSQDARETIRAHVYSIKKDWARLCDLRKQWGNAILKRWSSCVRVQRQSILREAFPNIASHRWVHIDHWYNATWDECRDKEARKSLAVRQSILLPWLNIGDLRDDNMNLLALLHHRIFGNPQQWLAFDTEQIRFGRESGLLETNYGRECFSTRADTYGHPRPFKIDELHRGSIYGYPIAELVFEAQALLYSFLRKTVEIILRPEGAGEGAEKWDEKANRSFPGSTHALEGPSRPPHFSRSPAWSAQECLTFANQNMDDAENELEQFQADPIHTQTEVAKIVGSNFWQDVNSSELTKWNTAARAVFEPALRRAVIQSWRTETAVYELTELSRASDQEWAMFRTSLITTLVAFRWDAIAVHIQIIQHLEKRVASRTPLHVEESLQTLLLYLERCATAHVQWDIHRVQSRSVALEPRLVKRISKKDKSVSAYNERTKLLDKYRQRKCVEKSDWDMDKFFWAVSHVCRWRHPPSPLMRAASEYLIESRFSAKGLPELDDTPLLRLVETMEAVQKLRTMLVGRRPGFQHIRNIGDTMRFSDKPRQIMKEILEEELHYTSGCSDFDHLLEDHGEWSTSLSYQIKDALGKFVARKYPRDSGKLSEPALEKAIECRKAMKEFWEVIREAHISRLVVMNDHISPEDVESSKEVWILHLSNRADEAMKNLQKRLDETRAKKAAAAAARGAKRDATAAEVTELERQGRVATSDITSPAKRRKTQEDKKSIKGAKKVTAGVLRDELPEPVAVLEADRDDDAPAEEPEKEAEPISVTKDHYKVFAKLWPYQSEINDGKSCTFQQLRAAMQEAGMDVVKVDGSHYNFKGVHGAVTLAAPHGRDSISKPLAPWRRTQYGQTLGRRLRWTFKSFVERDK